MLFFTELKAEVQRGKGDCSRSLNCQVAKSATIVIITTTPQPAPADS